MFFSLYASFRWAGTKNYVLKIAVFAIIASLLSAQVVTILFGVLGLDLLAFLSMLMGGFLNPSFPFSYNIWDEGRILLPPPYNGSQWIQTYEIRVPAISVLQLVPQGSIERSLNGGWGWIRVFGYRVVFLEMEIGSIHPDFTYAIGTLFLFFMLVNVTGALLGFLMSKLPMDKMSILKRNEWGSIGLFGRILFGTAFLVAGIWFSTIGKIILTGPVSRYYCSYDPNVYVGDAFACVIFGIIWLAMTAVEEKIL